MRNDLEKIKNEIINSKLINIYQTKKPFSTFWFEGLGNLLSYKFIIEIDNGKKYQLDSDYIQEWIDVEKIVELDSEFKDDFKNKTIVDLIFDPEYDPIYLKLNNKMLVFHNDHFGSELGYQNVSEIFDKNGKLI